jgi:vacuolar-type H+-ATPase subunit I/STV1
MAKVKASDLFLNSDVDVRRGGTDEKPNIVRVKGNRFISETDLTAKEIESIKPYGVMRIGTMAEMEAAENREDNESAAEAAKKAEEDRVALQQQQKLEADQLKAEQDKKAADERAKLEAEQAAERDKAAKAAAGSGKGKK